MKAIRLMSISLATVPAILCMVHTAGAVNCPTVTRPVCKCGDTVISDYQMTGDLLDGAGVARCSTGDGLSVASGVTVDCGNFTIKGNYNANGIQDKYGVFLADKDDVTIRRCNMTDFWTGARVEDSRDVRFEDNTVFDNGHYGIEVTDTTAVVSNSQRVTLVGNDISGNADEGIHMSTDAGLSVSPPQHIIMGNAVVDNGCEGIYILRIDGTSISNVGVRVFANVVYGNDSACAAGGTHAGIYVKDSSHNRFKYNSLTHDFMQLTDNSDNNKVLSTVINHSFLKLDDNSSDNSMNGVCVLGDTVTPGDSFQLKTNANNNSCGACAAYRPSSRHINAVGSSGNTFNNIRTDLGASPPSIEPGSGVTATTSTNALSCLE